VSLKIVDGTAVAINYNNVKTVTGRSVEEHLKHGNLPIRFCIPLQRLGVICFQKEH